MMMYYINSVAAAAAASVQSAPSLTSAEFAPKLRPYTL